MAGTRRPGRVRLAGQPAWRWVLATDLAALAPYLILGRPELGFAAFLIVSVSAVAALTLGPRRHGVHYTAPWTTVAVAVVLLGAGMLTRPATMTAPWPASALADVLTAPGYALLAAASVLLVRHYWRGREAPYAALDATMVLLGAASLSLAVFAIPASRHSTRPAPLAVLSGLYPLFDVGLLLGQVALAFTSAARLFAFRLVTIGVVALLAGDVSYAWVAAQGGDVVPRPVNFLSLLALACVAAGAAHPSMRGFNNVRLLDAHPWDRPRLLLIGGAVCLPSVATLLAHSGHLPQRAVLAAGCAAVSLALLWRATAAVNAQARSASDLAYRHTHDPLTGLPNREGMEEDARRELVSRRPPAETVSVLYVDVDGFKYVNDTHGHGVGDELLIAAAAAMTARVGDGGHVSRLGGDEFAVVVPDDASGSEGARLAAEVVAAFTEPFALSTGRFRASVSVGLSNSADRKNTTVEELLRDADRAMADAKTHPGSAWHRFDPADADDSRQRREIEAALREAVDGHQISVRFQPVVDLASQDVVAVEAVPQWSHPRLGVVPPSAFLPLAEDFGLFEAILRDVLDAGAAALADTDDGLALSVPVTARFLAADDVVDQVEAVLDRHGIAADRLRLEVREPSLAAANPGAAAAARALRERGVRLVIDDFGTGRGTLEALHGFGVDALKLNRSFVARVGRPGGDRAVAAAVAVAASLKATVVAEGVETRAERDELTRLGVSHGQGRLFGQPSERMPTSARR